MVLKADSLNTPNRSLSDLDSCLDHNWELQMPRIQI
jgi:hypothetical protein